MKRVFFLFLFTTIIFAQTGAKLFERVSNIPVPLKEHDGWGNFVTGFDLDNNGKIDLIAINHNAIDTDTEYVGSMIPTIYRYEYDAQSKTWSEIWNTTLANIPLQNTWPQLLAEDIDGDGKLEIIWSVVNYPSAKYNPNPDKIFIFKVNTDGTLGISDGLGGYTPNTATKVFDDSTSIYYNTRPYRMFVKDIDNDGKKELIYVDRVATSGLSSKSALEVVVMNVENIPTQSGSNATWTRKYVGKFNSPNYFTGTKYEGFILGNTIYAINTVQDIFGVKWDSGQQKFVTLPKQNLTKLNPNLKFAIGPYNTATVLDINNDGIEEVVLAEGRSKSATGKVALLQKAANSDTFQTATKILEMINIVKYDTARGLNGSAFGDLDKDGKVDIIMGGYGLSNNQKQANWVYRISYKGGDITSSSSYEVSVIDTAIHQDSGQLDVFQIKDIDKDGQNEVIYTSTYPRGIADYPYIPIQVLKGSVVGTENVKPNTFALYQNYPNPFNPSTIISFSIPAQTAVSLKIYNTLGQLIATLVDNKVMNAGNYKFSFNANNLPSGVYFYTLTSNNTSITKKMMLIK